MLVFPAEPVSAMICAPVGVRTCCARRPRGRGDVGDDDGGNANRAGGQHAGGVGGGCLVDEVVAVQAGAGHRDEHAAGADVAGVAGTAAGHPHLGIGSVVDGAARGVGDLGERQRNHELVLPAVSGAKVMARPV